MQMRCINFGACSLADSRTTMDGGLSSSCPECGESMLLSGQGNRFRLNLSFIGLVAGVTGAVVCMVIAGFWIFSAVSSSSFHQGKGELSPVISGPAKENDVQRPYAKVDAQALSVSPSGDYTISRLAQALCGGLNDDELKARAIFRWITANIAYDQEAFERQEPGELEPEAVIRKGKAVCGGIAKTFEALARSASIEAVYIAGRARLDEKSFASHAWNAVKIHGKWRLIDATFGIGYLKDADGLHATFDDYFFFPKPEEFIYTHYPGQAEWQLLKTPLTPDQFSQLPLRESRLFSYRIVLPAGLRDPLEVSRKAEFTFTAPENIKFKMQLWKDGQRLADNLTFIQRHRSVFVADAFLPEIGEYALLLYANDPDRPGQYINVHRQRVQNLNPCLTGARFPGILDTFSTYNGTLEVPIEGVLHPGANLFRMHLDHANAVFVSQDSHGADLHNENGTWQGKVVLFAGAAQVIGHFDNDPQAWILVKYEVIP
jgi:hypothetical protein